jgi:predicted nucleic acid-binding protein
MAVDSNIFVAAWLEQEPRYNEAIKLIHDLRAGDYVFHVSTLVPVEVCSAILRRTRSPARAYLAKRELENCVEEGYIKLYTLDEQRMNRAQGIVLRDRLKGADAIVAEVAEGLKVPLITFDQELSKRFKGVT